ncbi:nucleoporin nup189 [Niveomyces insectorum RCEF 264]|uniref:Nucleoporin nup189 n=1 Tax=Niveomyces insectorum RCEF 264 TaxID=1081102 RepID=A0A167ZYE8_9HYPO|nr:nucleoporin nup189 [Niveomyces insectorum RCEF 264]
MSFGSGGFGGFGQQNQTGGFGGFGAGNTAPTSGGFGTNTNAFGNTQNTGTSLFGNTGGGGFGSSTGAFGSTGAGGFGAKPAFGATTTAGGGLFGTPTATAGGPGFGSGGFGTTANTAAASPFGGGGGGGTLFGSANKPSFGTGTTTGGLFGSTASATPATFGGTTGGFGATANPGIGTNIGDPPGTAAVPFQPLIEKEATSNQQNSFQNILFMDNYKKWSADELRLADYNQGRRYGNATGAGAFGVSSNFGGFGANTTNAGTPSTGTGLFGSGSTAAGSFGAQNNTTAGGFGAANTGGGGLFGAKPAATGGLFGAATTNQPAQSGGLFGNTGGSFGTNTAGGFGANNATNSGGLFGNTAAQNKPATGFGFGAGAQNAGGFGSTGNTNAFGSTNAGTTTGGGLFGSTQANAGTTTGGGLFGTNTQTAAGSTGFGANTGGGFGAQNQTGGGGLFGQAKPATGGLFGAAGTNTTGTGTTGGGLFGSTAASTPFGGNANNATQQPGGLFGAKPATTTTGGGLFGSSVNQQAGGTGGGGLFGGLGQNTQTQQPSQPGSSLFGSTLGQGQQQKPSLFGTSAPGASGGLFGAQPNNQQQQGGGLFGQSSTAAQPQGNLPGGSLFGSNTQQTGNLGASQGLTTTINDAGAYGAPSLFQTLAAQEVHNPGPLATPLSVNKTKTSRRSSILPLYKMNPGSASKFATPQKRGYGLSYSTFGSPSSISSTASTPGSLNQSLLAGSISRSALTKSISSSNLRRTYNAEDSILLPGAFSANTGPRYYGSTGGSKKLVINRDMRSDLFSTPTKVGGTGNSDPTANGGAGLGSSRKLTKRVSFDTTIAKNAVSVAGQGTNGTAGTSTGFLRPQIPTVNSPGSATSTSSATTINSHTTTNINTNNPSNNGIVSGPSSGSVSPSTESQATSNGLGIVPEEGSSTMPSCIPDNYSINSKELGEYWMWPSKDEIESMNRMQRAQVSDFTVGRTNVGQVRFLIPVDLTKIDLDSIMDGIVTLIIRSATVYPDVNTKPPVGQGLNVPAEILLLHTCPRSGPSANPAKLKKHVMRLQQIPDTKFISYDEKIAAWVFRVEHFTTYGLDDDDDETDVDATGLSTAEPENTPSTSFAAQSPGQAGPGRRKYVSLPGAFDDSHGILSANEDEDETPHPSFLSSGSAGLGSFAVMPVETMDDDDEAMELSQNGVFEPEGEAPQSQQHDSAAELDKDDSLENSLLYPSLSLPAPETPAGVMRARLRAIKESNTPRTIQVADGDNWLEMLQKTVSPQKRDRAALKAMGELGAADPSLKESPADFRRTIAASKPMASRNRKPQDNRGFVTSIDLMNSLFEKAKAPPAEAPKVITPAKGFVQWPHKRMNKPAGEDATNDDLTEQAFRNTLKPVWPTEGVCIVSDGQGQGNDDDEPSLKRIRIFNATKPENDPLESILVHKEFIDVEVVNGVPAASTRRVPRLQAFAGFCEQANRRRATAPNSVAQQLGSYEQSIWDLASILFDPVQAQFSSPKEEGRSRRDRLAQFWAQLVQDSSSAKSLEQAQTLEEKAVLHLAGRKVPEACRALVDGKNFKAATLLSLIGTSDAFKKDMREQMDDWQQGDVLAEFSVPLRTIYSMLAGSVAVCEGKKGGGIENRVDSVVIADWFVLDWRQAFGLRLWYGISAGDGFEAAVAKYVEDLEQGRVPAPRPWYTSRRDLPLAWADPHREQREDLLFGLLKVAAGLARLEDVLEPENVQPSPFRFRLSWQINQALAAAKANMHPAASTQLPTEKADALTIAYASEVVSQSSDDSPEDGAHNGWIHGIWVLLHLSDRTARTRAIQSVLGRHIGALFKRSDGALAKGLNLYERLVNDLKIPASWVWQAAALYWRNQQNQPALEAECLLRAAAFADAHRIFVKELAPKAIVERNYGDIAEMLGKLQPHRHQVPDWSLGGEVYSRFLDLLTLQRGGTLAPGNERGGTGGGAATRTRGRQQQARDEAEQASAQRISAVEALVASLPAVYDNAGDDARAIEVAAITEMADVVAKETMALANLGRMDLTKISRLPLTEGRRLRYSTDLAFAYYREVMTAH